MDVKKIEKLVESISLPIIESLGYELIDVEFVNEEDEWYLRIYIDNNEAINIDDCARVSRAIDGIIEQADPIDIGYFLEVCSPGPNRKLKYQRDFDKFKGNAIKIFLIEAIDEKYEIEGSLEGFSDEKISININNNILDIYRSNIKEVRLNNR